MSDELKPDGWHAIPQAPSHTMRDGLFIGGLLRAIVEAFGDDGPWYANALTPEGKYQRLGAGASHSSSAEWCERVTGYATRQPVSVPAVREGRS